MLVARGFGAWAVPVARPRRFTVGPGVEERYFRGYTATVRVDPDCGNSPRKAFIRDFNIAFAEGDVSFLVEHAGEDIVWRVVGNKELSGKSEYERELGSMAGQTVRELTIHSIVTHGREAAANGTLVMENDERYEFCDVYSFTGAKGNTLKKICSYVIPSGAGERT